LYRHEIDIHLGGESFWHIDRCNPMGEGYQCISVQYRGSRLLLEPLVKLGLASMHVVTTSEPSVWVQLEKRLIRR